MTEKVNLAAKLAAFDDLWNPRVVADLNGQQVKVAKVHGEFCWHRHEAEDEMFLVVRGRLRILLRDREVALEPGEMFVVPRGVEHKPVADVPTEIVLFEPASTLNTGDAKDDRTRETLERI